MKENKQHGAFSFITGGGTYQEAKFEEDADTVVAHYRNKGYIEAQVGTPELKTLRGLDGRQDPLDPAAHAGHRGRALQGRRVRLRRQHGRQDRRACGRCSSCSRATGTARSAIRDGLRKAQEVYGGGGYFEFTGYPDLKPHDRRPRPGPLAGAGRARPST